MVFHSKSLPAAKIGEDNNSYSCFSALGYSAIFHKPFTVQSLVWAFLELLLWPYPSRKSSGLGNVWKIPKCYPCPEGSLVPLQSSHVSVTKSRIFSCKSAYPFWCLFCDRCVPDCVVWRNHIVQRLLLLNKLLQYLRRQKWNKCLLGRPKKN